MYSAVLARLVLPLASEASEHQATYSSIKSLLCLFAREETGFRSFGKHFRPVRPRFRTLRRAHQFPSNWKHGSLWTDVASRLLRDGESWLLRPYIALCGASPARTRQADRAETPTGHGTHILPNSCRAWAIKHVSPSVGATPPALRGVHRRDSPGFPPGNRIRSQLSPLAAGMGAVRV